MEKVLMNRSSLSRLALVLTAGLSLTACASTATTVSRTTPTPYAGPQTTSGRTLIEQLQWAAQDVKPEIVFMVGKVEDQTGQHKDAEALRYSRAVTQGGPNILSNYVRAAGFQLAERDPYNMGLLTQEYALSHQFTTQQGQAPTQVGLIQRGGPNGGLVGANYMVTGGIVSYSSSSNTGGGGADVDGVGASFRYSKAEVSVVLRIVEVSSGLTVSTLHVTSVVTGSSTNFHFTRFIGDVASTLATVSGGTSTATILRPASNAHIASAEFGGAQQLPIDYAVTDAFVFGLARLLEVNQDRFYQKPVRLDYNVVGKN